MAANSVRWPSWNALLPLVVAPQGTRQTRKFKSLKRYSILLRAVRHHDDHSPLAVGRPGDYHTLDWKDLDGGSEGCFETPWTDTQQLFMFEDRPVRPVHGYPGSDKTVAPWGAVEARASGRTLYLSWSRADGACAGSVLSVRSSRLGCGRSGLQHLHRRTVRQGRATLVSARQPRSIPRCLRMVEDRRPPRAVEKQAGRPACRSASGSVRMRRAWDVSMRSRRRPVK